MKNVFVIHGYNGDTTETFGPYIKKECEKRNLPCFFPTFPIREEATFENWAGKMDQFLNEQAFNEETIVIAHSLGTRFWPMYASLKHIKIHTFISIAGFLQDHSGREDLGKVVQRFAPTQNDFDNLIHLTQNRYAIYSDNDHLNPQEELERYAEKIQAQKVFIKGKGHFGRKSGVKQLPEVIKIMEEN